MRSNLLGPWVVAGCLLLLIPRSSSAQDVEGILTRDDLNAFQSLIGIDADSLFHESISAEAAQIAGYLISTGARLDARDQNGQTALLIAVNNGYLSLTRQLLNAGANPDVREQGGLEGTPLMYATALPSTDFVDLLLENGADVNVVDTNGDPALNWASYYGHVRHMQMLIDAGADLTIESKHGDAVDVVLRLWHADSVAVVFRETTLAADMSDEETSFFRAVQAHDESSVLQLLEEGVDPNAKDGLGIPMLHLAVQFGLRDIVDDILRFGAEVNLYNRVGQTPLVNAVLSGHVDLVHLLLAHGADPDAAGSEYRLTPLMAAAVKGDENMGRLLLAAGASIDARDVVNEASALHWAEFYGNEAFAVLLLDQGADYSKPTLAGEYTALTLAEAYGQDLIQQAIRSRMARRNDLIGSWAVTGIHWVTQDTTYSIDQAQPGRLIISPDRYAIMYNPTNKLRVPFASLSNPEADEMIAAFQSIVFNSGRYELSDSLFVTTSDIARVPGFEGGKQFFRYVVQDDQLYFSMIDETYPDGSKPSWAGHMTVQFVLKRE